MHESVSQIAEAFGLTIETTVLPEHANALRVFKGAKQIFIGTEEAVREFLAEYKSTRPGLLEESLYGYKE